MFIMDIFSNNLRTQRKKKGYSQSKIAELLGVRPNTISNYESGVSQPDLDAFVKIIKILDVSPSVLLGIEANSTDTDSILINEKLQPYETTKCQQCDLRERLIQSHEKTIAALEATLKEVMDRRSNKSH